MTSASKNVAHLFGSDSDDSESENNKRVVETKMEESGEEEEDEQEGSTTVSRDKTKSSRNRSALFGDDDMEDEEGHDDDVAREEENEIEEEEEEAKDGDDVEFEDDGIVGSSAPRSSTRARVVADDDEDDYYNDDTDRGQNARRESGDSMKYSSSGDGVSVPALPPRRIAINNIPNLKAIYGGSSSSVSNASKVTYHITQLPKIVAINSEPYDRSTFDAKAEDDEFKRHVHNMIRWRYISKQDPKNSESFSDSGMLKENLMRHSKTGKLLRESNTNIIKWSDGTWGLAVGEEVFELDEFPSGMNNAPDDAVTRGDAPVTKNSSSDVGGKGDDMNESKEFLYLSNKAYITKLNKKDNEEDEKMENDDDESSDLIDVEESASTQISTILECVVPLSSKFIPRPASIQSTAHKTFALAERTRNMKRTKISTHVPLTDPELEKAQRIRNNEDLLKQRKRSSAGGDGRKSFGSSFTGRKRASLGRRGEEEDEYDDYYDTINVSSIKRRNNEDEDDYGDYDDEEEEDEWSKRKKQIFQRNEGQKNRSRLIANDQEGEGFSSVHENEDEKIAVRKKPAPSTFFAVDDEDEDD